MRRQPPIQYAGASSAIGAAMTTEAIASEYDLGYVFGNGHGVFAPNDGFGTPSWQAFTTDATALANLPALFMRLFGDGAQREYGAAFRSDSRRRV